MAEADVRDTEEDGVVTMEESCLSAREETHVRVSYTTRGAGKQEEESDSLMQPLLQQKHHDENHKAGTQTTADEADPKTSVPQELESAVRDQAGCSGSVRSACSDGSGRHECPICSGPLDSHEEGRVTLLCNHALCHSCTAGIMRRAKEPGRLRCPLCRQTTPFPQWEIRRLQEESYFTSVHQPAQALFISLGPELQTVPASPWCCPAHTHRSICGCCVYPSWILRGLRLHCLCFALNAFLLLFLVLLGCFLYMALPAIMQAIRSGNG